MQTWFVLTIIQSIKPRRKIDKKQYYGQNRVIECQHSKTEKLRCNSICFFSSYSTSLQPTLNLNSSHCVHKVFHRSYLKRRHMDIFGVDLHVFVFHSHTVDYKFHSYTFKNFTKIARYFVFHVIFCKSEKLNIVCSSYLPTSKVVLRSVQNQHWSFEQDTLHHQTICALCWFLFDQFYWIEFLMFVISELRDKFFHLMIWLV